MIAIKEEDHEEQQTYKINSGGNRHNGTCNTGRPGAGELITVWKDPDFDPAQLAFYYVRVIEIPTPRWSAYDAKYYRTKPLPGTPMVVTERAYTSPIWYTPK